MNQNDQEHYNLAANVASRDKTNYTKIQEFKKGFIIGSLLCTIILFALHIYEYQNFYLTEYSHLTNSNSYKVLQGTIEDISYKNYQAIDLTLENDQKEKIRLVNLPYYEPTSLYTYFVEPIAKGDYLTIRFDQENPAQAYYYRNFFVDYVFKVNKGKDVEFFLISWFFPLTLLFTFIYLRNMLRFKDLKRKEAYFTVKRIEKFDTKNNPQQGTLYAPYYALELNNYPTILFRDKFIRQKDLNSFNNDNTIFRIYMYNIDNPKDERYLIEKVLK